MKKSILYCIAILIAIYSCMFSAIAHPSPQSTQLDSYIEYDEYGNEWQCVGSESIGWVILDECHLGSCIGSYKFSVLVPDEYRELFYDAVDIWENSTQAQMTEDENAIGKIYIETKSYENYVAMTAYDDTDSNGHLLSWAIVMNDYYNVTADILAHEIGHVWGLNDLYEDSNINKLMYAYSTCTATAPTSSDIKGFNVITGLHTTHTWLYKNAYQYCSICSGRKTETHRYVWTDYSGTKHKGTCSLCGKIVYESHEPYFTTSCLRCGSETILIVTGISDTTAPTAICKDD